MTEDIKEMCDAWKKYLEHIAILMSTAAAFIEVSL